MKSKFIKIWNVYEFQTKTGNPIKTKMATAFVMFSLGDGICQFGIEKVKHWDYKRTLRAAFIAGGFMNPLS